MPADKKFHLLLKANESLVEDLKTALSIPPEILLKLNKYFNTVNGYELRENDLNSVLKIWSATKMSPDRVKDVFSILKHFFDSIIDNEIEVDTFLSEIKELCNVKKIEGFEESKEVIKKLLTPKKTYLQNSKIISWAGNIVQNLVSFDGTVQLRGAFNAVDSTDLMGYLPIIQIRLLSSPNYGEGNYNEFIFQLNEHTLDDLINKLQILKKQVTSIKKDVVDKVNILNI
jgi:hypothetical protein